MLGEYHSVTTRFGPTDVTFNGFGDGKNWTLEPIAQEICACPTSKRTVWMPTPSSANALLAPHAQFTDEHTVGNTVFKGKVFADGCVIPQGDHFAVMSADCPTIVAYGAKKSSSTVIAAHAARDSVTHVDRGHFGVVHSVLNLMCTRGIKAEHVCIGIFGGIRSNFLHNPSHPEYGLKNRNLLEFAQKFDENNTDESTHIVRDFNTGDIDLYHLIRAIAIKSGVRPGAIFLDDVDTGSDLGADGKPIWASYRNGSPKQRNLCLVHHRCDN